MGDAVDQQLRNAVNAYVNRALKKYETAIRTGASPEVVRQTEESARTAVTSVPTAQVDPRLLEAVSRLEKKFNSFEFKTRENANRNNNYKTLMTNPFSGISHNNRIRLQQKYENLPPRP
jgi:hypothetical protein